MLFKSRLTVFVSALLLLYTLSEKLSHAGLVPSKNEKPPRDAQIEMVYALGDSYADDGTSGVMSAFNLTKIVMTQPPAPPKPKEAEWLPANPDSEYVRVASGRWTNGPIAIEVPAGRRVVTSGF